ncbi:phage major tail tube protein [Metapseudomonas otitidis]|uniref:phage major tail tube protein n=1 Tax=Metapseudomonas otitidis TaxID=319939 RepID=UPI0013F5E213|nr:phage major tail tube protein [Pseudomonas otitidis]
MAMPSKLKNMMLFNDGVAYGGLAKTVTLPPLSRKMEGYRGGGMHGTVKADLGLSDDGIVVEWTAGGLVTHAIRQFGATSASAVPLRFAGAYQADDTGTVTAVEVVLRGRHETVEMGDATPGEDTEQKVTTTCSYYKLTVDGEVLVEIDLLNFIEIIDGQDMLEAQRKAIGL